MSEQTAVLAERHWRVESAGENGRWSRWGEASSETDARQYLDASRANNSDRVFRLIEVTTTEVLLDD